MTHWIPPRVSSLDHYVWIGHSIGRFTIDLTWEALRDIRPNNTMHYLLWFPGHVPRHSFILWLASLGHLHTMNKPHNFQIITFTIYILCGSHVKTYDHFIFWVLLLSFSIKTDLKHDFITLAFYFMKPFSSMGFPSVSRKERLHAYFSMFVTLCHNLPYTVWEEYSCLLLALPITTWNGGRDLQLVEIMVSRHRSPILDICRD